MKRPLKAPSKSITDEELDLLSFPVYGSPKLDGFRCLIDGIPKTASMKPMPNPFVQSELSLPELNGLDGELIVGDPNDPNAFKNSTGPLRRQYGEPDFHFFVFDNFLFDHKSYEYRWLNTDYLNKYSNNRIIALYQLALHSPEQVITYEDLCIQQGYEGAMIRTTSSLYKQGRATFKEMNIFKRKPFTDTEGMIIGFTEQMTNLNPKFTNEMGLTKRATNQENLVGAETLGNFIVRSKEWAASFACGGGQLTHEERKLVWDNQDKFLGRTITFKYQKHGSLDAPRSPIFLRFRDEL